MRIIKRGRRHIVISPSGLPFDVDAAKAQPRSAASAPIVRFDQLPADLQRALTQPRPAADSLPK